jgi:hypothetical protein
VPDARSARAQCKFRRADLASNADNYFEVEEKKMRLRDKVRSENGTVGWIRTTDLRSHNPAL